MATAAATAAARTSRIRDTGTPLPVDSSATVHAALLACRGAMAPSRNLRSEVAERGRLAGPPLLFVGRPEQGVDEVRAEVPERLGLPVARLLAVHERQGHEIGFLAADQVGEHPRGEVRGAHAHTDVAA